jgi:hypothetical protein
MARMELSLFGGFDLSSGGEPVTGFKTDKVRALLCLPERQQGDLSTHKNC